MDWMNARRAALGSANMQATGRQFDLVPFFWAKPPTRRGDHFSSSHAFAFILRRRRARGATGLGSIKEANAVGPPAVFGKVEN